MNLVNELQVSTEQDEVLTVLRKTRRLASKLGRQDINEWLEHEQTGYQSKDVPDYRQVNATLAINTNGYIPAGYGFVQKGIQDLPSSGLNVPMPVTEPISTIQTWTEKTAEPHRHGLYFPIEKGDALDNSIRQYIQVHPMFADQITFLYHLNESQVQAIPERVKDKVLQWACALEAAGVTGDGLSFTTQERQIAQTVVFNINNSHVGQLNNSGENRKG